MISDYAFLIPILPVIAFVLTLAFGRRLPAGGAIFSILAIAGSAVISILIFLQLYPHGEPIHQSMPWFSVLNFGILIDPLASVMLVMVSFVSLLIHIYAVGYMSHDPGKPRYFAETSLFTAAMLGVVLSDNILQFFMAWEIVGLCSYLLIGFWYRKPSAAAAAKKAFLVTRVGDVLFLAGIVLLYFNMLRLDLPSGTYLLQFTTIFENVSRIPSGQLTLITLLFFGGAVGKSGQFPLHGWLPDAMEGPTTVSALIHAATMVTAGVYLVARTFPMYLAAPDSLLVVAYIGGFTALFASTMGLVMNDIKRVLAYSTVSQLGYMMLGLGMGAVIGAEAVGISMFHLISHAFFKALLFLCAGSVIHAMATNDIREMGGLFGKMKVTAITMLLGAFALAGIPPTSGFFSKDAIILEGTYTFWQSTGDMLPFFFGAAAAVLTSIYTFRLWFMTFTGKPRSERHAHESPAVMTIPLALLGILALVFGGLAVSLFIPFVSESYEHSLVVELAPLGGYELGEIAHAGTVIQSIPIIAGVGGFIIAWLIYNRRLLDVSRIVKASNPLYRLLLNRYYLDNLFTDFIGVRITHQLFAMLGEWTDRKVIDGIIDGISGFLIACGELLRKVQTGVVQNYATAVIIGVTLIAISINIITGRF